MKSANVERGIGCASLIPAGLIGLAGLTDGIGPTGWRGFAELFGWFVACLAGALLAAFLLARGGRTGAKGYALAMVVVIAIGVLSYELVSWLGLGAPMSAKILFTSSLQVIGSLGAGACVVWAIYAVWSSRQR